MEFNVLTNSWIPIEYSNGMIDELGIMECLEKAHQIKSISNSKQYEKIAILRLIVAFVSDAYELKRSNDRKALFDSGRFDMDILQDYVDKSIREHGASFDLFDGNRPFMSYSFDPEIDNEETRLSAVYLHIELPHGNNPIHIVGQKEEDFLGDTPAQFLRALLSSYLYPTGNMLKGSNKSTGAQCYIKEYDKNNKPKYDSQYGSMGINAGPSMAAPEPVFFWPEGGNLFQTIVMCMQSAAELGNIPLNDPPAPWNTDKKIQPNKTKRGDPVTKVSFVSALTFQSRRVVPIVDDDGSIKNCYITNGYVNPDNILWHDPFAVQLKNSKTGELYYLKADETKSMWRNVGNITASSHDSNHLMPDVLKPIKKYDNIHYERIVSLGLVPKTQCAGYDSLLFDDSIEIPSDYLREENLGSYLTTRMEIIESVAQVFDSLNRISQVSDKRKYNLLGNDAKESYWFMMHQYLMDQENNFLSIARDYYYEDDIGFEKKADTELFLKMKEIVSKICSKEISNSNSWNMMRTTVDNVDVCMKGFYNKTKELRKDVSE